jgi:hypothetical protein
VRVIRLLKVDTRLEVKEGLGSIIELAKVLVSIVVDPPELMPVFVIAWLGVESSNELNELSRDDGGNTGEIED